MVFINVIRRVAEFSLFVGVIILCTSNSLFAAQNWFVATTSNAINYPPTQGMAANAPFRTISWALKYANPGDTIYVKAGKYDATNDDYSELVQGRNPGYRDSEGIHINTENIKIIGYSGEFGTQSYAEPTVPASLDEFEQLEGTWHSAFPTVVGVNRGTNVGFHVNNKKDVEIKGFAVEFFQTGVEFVSPDATSPPLNGSASSLLLSKFGDPFGPNDFANDGYDGFGVNLQYAKGTTVSDCFLVDSEAVGFQVLVGDDMTFLNCQAYGRGFVSSNRPAYQNFARKGMDYGFLLNATNGDGSSGCKITNCQSYFATIHQVPGIHDSPHHFAISTAGTEELTNNQIENCVGKQGADGILLRGKNTHNNIIKDVQFDKTNYPIKLRRGPHDNEFRKLTATEACRAVQVVVTSGDHTHSNSFINCGFELHAGPAGPPFYGIEPAILGSQTSSFMTEIRDNAFFRCTFVGPGTPQSSVGRFHSANVSATGNEFINCIVQGFEEYQTNVATTFDTDFEYCCFHDSPFWSVPSSATISSSNSDDPGIVGTTQGNGFDFHLDPGNYAGGAYQLNGAADRGIELIDAFQLLDATLTSDLTDIDNELMYDPVYSGGSIRIDIGCDEFAP